jgi:predicted RNA-binding protein YlxR (DUF448 family)
VASTDRLVRVVRGLDGELRQGVGLPGRGAWLCAATPSCVDQAARRQAFGRALRAPVTAEAVDRLQQGLRSVAAQEGCPPQVCEDGDAGRVAGPRPHEEEGS